MQKLGRELGPVTLCVQGARVRPPHGNTRLLGCLCWDMLSTSRTKRDAECLGAASQRSAGLNSVTSEMPLLRTTWMSVFRPFK